MARRDPVGAATPACERLDGALAVIVEILNHLKVRSCLIDGEVVRCDAQE